MDLPTSAPLGRGVYCNRTLNMRAIKVIGYDMDYTLVQYHTEDWEHRVYDHLKRRLQERGLPVNDLTFDAQLVARGVTVDTERGNLLKTNRFGYVKTAYHGTKRLSYEALRDDYMRNIVSLSDPRYVFVNTLFALSEGCMYAQLVDKLDAGAFGDKAMGYRDLYALVRSNVDATHTEGELKAEIMRHPDKFVVLEEETALALLDQKHAGKRLMLITNSEWHFSRAMMHFTFDRYLPDGMSWRNLFEIVVVAARKPAFFDSDTPLLKIVNDEGLLSPLNGPVLKDGCYFGGNAVALERYLGVNGDEILYLGDHMYGDVHVSKNALRWRTGLVLRELEDELAAVEQTRDLQFDLSELMRQKEELEWQSYQLRVRLQRRRDGYGPQADTSDKALQAKLAELREKTEALDARIGPLAAETGRAHNPHWGLLLRAGNDKSQLARQLERYADVYTSRVSNLLFTTPFAYLRSRRGSLPHDPTPKRAPVTQGRG